MISLLIVAGVAMTNRLFRPVAVGTGRRNSCGRTAVRGSSGEGGFSLMRRKEIFPTAGDMNSHEPSSPSFSSSSVSQLELKEPPRRGKEQTSSSDSKDDVFSFGLISLVVAGREEEGLKAG